MTPNDNSSDCRRWSNRKLMAQARKLANLTEFGSYFREQPMILSVNEDAGPFVRETTRLYRETWLAPILDEIERRFVR